MSARRGVPLAATLLTLVMIPVLVWLGAWQLERRSWKIELIAQAEAAPKLPPVSPREFFEAMNGTRSVQYRRAEVDCFPGTVKPYDLKGGISSGGETGYLVLVDCGDRAASGKPGPDMVVVAGWTRRPDAAAALEVRQRFTGLVIEHPYGKAQGRPQFMLIPTAAAPPLAPSRQPTPGDLPNNHFSYALQWFAFALTLAVIYGIYVMHWRRNVTLS